MQIKAITVASFAAGAYSQSLTSYDTASIVSVLRTALPSSVFSQAANNPAQFSSALYGSLSSSETPGWFSSLPSDIQSIITAEPTITRPSVPGATGVGSNGTTIIGGGSNGTVIVNGTTSSGRNTRTATGLTTSTTGSGSGDTSTDSSGSAETSGAGFQGGSSSSTGGAPLPTAFYGMGIAGVAGLVGVLAL